MSEGIILISSEENGWRCDDCGVLNSVESRRCEECGNREEYEEESDKEKYKTSSLTENMIFRFPKRIIPY